MGDSIIISAVLPVYNQRDRIDLTLRMFDKQTFPKEKFEVIVVDDGSTDITEDDLKKWSQFAYNLHIIRQKNSGRAAARNRGIENARGEYLIFCDGDRFPSQMYIEEYYNRIQADQDKSIVYIGCPMNYFGKITDVEDEQKVRRYSRPFAYYSKIKNMYADDGTTSCSVAWASFLVGNSCVSKEMLMTAGNFDETFDEWGFEHYELAIRLEKNSAKFVCIPDNYNFHIPHSQKKEFYKDAMLKSVEIISKKHEEHDYHSLLEFMYGNISLQQFEQMYAGKVCEELSSKDEIYFKM